MIWVDEVQALESKPLPEPPSPFANGYAGGFGDTLFVDGLDRDEDVPTLAECNRDEAGR